MGGILLPKPVLPDQIIIIVSLALCPLNDIHTCNDSCGFLVLTDYLSKPQLTHLELRTYKHNE